MLRLQVQTDQNMSTEDLQAEIRELDKHLEALELKGVEVEANLRQNKNGLSKFSGKKYLQAQNHHCFCLIGLLRPFYFRRRGGTDANGVAFSDPRETRSGAQRHRAGSSVSRRGF